MTTFSIQSPYKFLSFKTVLRFCIIDVPVEIYLLIDSLRALLAHPWHCFLTPGIAGSPLALLSHPWRCWLTPGIAGSPQALLAHPWNCWPSTSEHTHGSHCIVGTASYCPVATVPTLPCRYSPHSPLWVQSSHPHVATFPTLHCGYSRNTQLSLHSPHSPVATVP